MFFDHVYYLLRLAGGKRHSVFFFFFGLIYLLQHSFSISSSF
jgi:hypothetical protein